MIGIPFWEFTAQGVCSEGDEFFFTISQLHCQRKCEENTDCVGVSYYDYNGDPDTYHSYCIICNEDKLNQSSPYAFYKRPGSRWIT